MGKMIATSKPVKSRRQALPAGLSPMPVRPDNYVLVPALLLLGGGPWGSAGRRNLPTLGKEVELTRLRLEEGTPVIGIGLGAQILAIAAGGGSRETELVFEVGQATRTRQDALNGFLPETFTHVVYMRDFPVLPPGAETLAVDGRGRPAVFRIGDNAYGFTGHPGIKLGMVEDLVMEFEEVPAGAAAELEKLRGLQRRIEDELVRTMTGLVQCTSLMSSPRAAGRPPTTRSASSPPTRPGR